MATHEHFALKSRELEDGAMKELTLDGVKVLLARVAGEIHAVDGVCPHYGGPLAEGTLCGNRVRCPWHQGCFDVTTGDLLEPPPLVSLRHFKVRVNGDDILVQLPADSVPFRDPPAAPRDQSISLQYVIIGAGAAGACAAQSLREAGFRGAIKMISAEAELPYDRPALSKNHLANHPLDHPLPLQPTDFYERLEIERITRTVAGLDQTARTIRFKDGGSISFDKLLIAPGATPRRLHVPGEHSLLVFTLRSLSDCQAIIAAAGRAKRAALIGSGFIGMEAAACLRQRGLDVVVVTPERIPMASKLGEPVGRMFQAIHEKNGVTFRLGAKVTRFDGRSVVLSDGPPVDADMAIVAVGVRPATDFLKGSLPLNDDGSLTVDATMQVSGAKGIYAAGDVARFPRPLTGERIRIEHWRTAQQLGRVAAFNMAGIPTTLKDPPYFWTYQFDVGLDYVGHAETWDTLHVDGDPALHDFLAYYVKADAIVAVSGCNRSDQTCAIAELMRARAMPPASALLPRPPNWVALLKDYRPR